MLSLHDEVVVLIVVIHTYYIENHDLLLQLAYLEVVHHRSANPLYQMPEVVHHQILAVGLHLFEDRILASRIPSQKKGDTERKQLVRELHPRFQPWFLKDCANQLSPPAPL